MPDSIRIIKKYPNRRLYDTANSGYITLADVKQMVLDNIDFQVVDAKSGDDLTRAILLQIILEEESGGVPMFSSEMLAQIVAWQQAIADATGLPVEVRGGREHAARGAATQIAAILRGQPVEALADAWRPPVVATIMPRPEMRECFRLHERLALAGQPV